MMQRGTTISPAGRTLPSDPYAHQCPSLPDFRTDVPHSSATAGLSMMSPATTHDADVVFTNVRRRELMEASRGMR